MKRKRPAPSQASSRADIVFFFNKSNTMPLNDGSPTSSWHYSAVKKDAVSVCWSTYLLLGSRSYQRTPSPETSWPFQASSHTGFEWNLWSHINS